MVTIVNFDNEHKIINIEQETDGIEVPKAIDYEHLFEVVTQHIIAIICTGKAEEADGNDPKTLGHLTDLFDNIEDIIICDNEELKEEIEKLKRKTTVLFGEYERLRKQNRLSEMT